LNVVSLDDAEFKRLVDERKSAQATGTAHQQQQHQQ
jgi:hypothetical protein